LTVLDSFWPGAATGAVSLTFDDGLQSQLDTALPALDEFGLKGTFYVNPQRREEWAQRSLRWREAGLDGHEIGNHTTRHPCSCNFGFDEAFCLERLTVEEIAETIDEAETLLDELLPEQKSQRSFCYPCYQSYAGAGEGRRSYVPAVARRFRVARGGGERPNDPRVVDLSYVYAEDVQGQSGQQMIAYIEDAVHAGRWAILCMHGVGDEHLSIEAEAFGQVVAYLHADRERIWTGTVIEVADRIIHTRTS